MKRAVCMILAAMLLLAAVPSLADWAVGDTFKLGKWSMEGDPKSIKWTVIHVTENGKLMLAMANEPVAFYPYHSEEGIMSWENSSLRQWLNSDFLKTAFTSKQRKQLQMQLIKNTPFTEDPDAGRDTMDYIYVLSSAEAGLYLQEGMLARGCEWWLRDHGADGAQAVYVDAEGLVVEQGAPLTESRAIFPVITLMTSAISK